MKIIFEDNTSKEKILFENFRKEFSIDPIFLNCDLKISLGGFNKTQSIDIELSELKFFLKHLEKFIQDEIPVINFKNLDSIFEISISKSKEEIISVSGKFNNENHLITLAFNFESNLLYINQLKSDITFIIDSF